MFHLSLPALTKILNKEFLYASKQSSVRKPHIIFQVNTLQNHICVVPWCMIGFPSSSSMLHKFLFHEEWKLGNHHLLHLQQVTQLFLLTSRVAVVHKFVGPQIHPTNIYFSQVLPTKPPQFRRPTVPDVDVSGWGWTVPTSQKIVTTISYGLHHFKKPSVQLQRCCKLRWPRVHPGWNLQKIDLFFIYATSSFPVRNEIATCFLSSQHPNDSQKI